MINCFSIYLLDKLEKFVANKKRYYISKENASFLKKYHLSNDFNISGKKQDYNGYQGTPINLCKCLLKSSILQKSDTILDVGCGAGIFISYFLSNNFLNISGVEIDESLCAAAIKNITNVVSKEKIVYKGKIYNSDFFELNCIDEYNVFYIFNSFNSEKAYFEFLERIKMSFIAKPRKIKLIFLYLNAISKKVLNCQNWITKTRSISDNAQFCNMCIKFTIYESI